MLHFKDTLDVKHKLADANNQLGGGQSNMPCGQYTFSRAIKSKDWRYSSGGVYVTTRLCEREVHADQNDTRRCGPRVRLETFISDEANL